MVVPRLQHAARPGPLPGVGLEAQDLGIILMAAVRTPWIRTLIQGRHGHDNTNCHPACRECWPPWPPSHPTGGGAAGQPGARSRTPGPAAPWCRCRDTLRSPAAPVMETLPWHGNSILCPLLTQQSQHSPGLHQRTRSCHTRD